MSNPAHSAVLVVAAHPDDEVLGCGGTMAKLAASGHHVQIAILGEGLTSRSARREDANPQLVATLETHSRRAADLLGAEELRFFGLPDNRFDTVPLLDVVKLVEEAIDRWQPETVFTHHGGDLNVDHGVVHRAVLTATRPLPGCPVRELFAFEVPSSTEFAFQQLTPVFRPNTFVEIAGTVEVKIAAMEVYESERRPFPHPRSPQALRAIARKWGSTCGVDAAEAFELIRGLR
jgi:LmbE family N-acetylglucosaminyl deacetylase